jgi:hypothetical protein
VSHRFSFHAYFSFYYLFLCPTWGFEAQLRFLLLLIALSILSPHSSNTSHSSSPSLDPDPTLPYLFRSSKTRSITPHTNTNKHKHTHTYTYDDPIQPENQPNPTRSSRNTEVSTFRDPSPSFFLSGPRIQIRTSDSEFSRNGKTEGGTVGVLPSLGGKLRR